MSTANDKSKMVVFLFAFFLGCLGVHRFYVGKVGSGVAWLLTGGILGVGWLIDWIMVLCGKFKDKEGNLIQ